MTRTTSARLSGLDGLRAVAVLLVVVYHLFPALPSGFLGVDVFFVISGFLITTLLMREREQDGRIGLASFWRRRARRLLPAIAVMVLVCSSIAWLIGGDVLVGVGGQLLGAATFAYNWVAIAAGSSYFGGGSFDATAPELFRNLWSLAVEEQFYLLWPLLLPAVLALRSWRTPVAVGLAAASAGLAVLLAGDVTRVYYGTDTHAFGLLLGVALAFLRPASHAKGVPAPVGAAAVAGVVALAFVTPGTDAATFPGLLVAASVLSAVAIAAAVRPGSPLGRALDVAPLQWIGERSFGIYLWHWPIVVLMTVATTGVSPDVEVPLPVGAITLALSLIVAELSYRFVEQPVRRRGLRATLRGAARAFGAGPARRLAATAAVAAGALLIAGTSAAVADAPTVASSQAVVEHGREALDAASRTRASHAQTLPGAAVRSEDPVLRPQCPTANLSDDEGLCTAPDGRPAPPAPARVAGDRVTAVGDSVMLASAPSLLERMPGVEIDAKVSRPMSAGVGILSRLADAGDLGDYVVVGLGTNGAISEDDLSRIRSEIGHDRTLVLVTAYAPRDWIPGVNADLEAFASHTPGVVVADWSAAIGRHTDLLAGDGIHPGRAGGDIYADAVSTAIEDVENGRAELQYRLELAQWAVGDTFTRP
ncbi:acetyltransferase [Microbacterium sp. EYE_5]|uniref:acyltransferase family protein n=1 Tax=unclassified Microbacterium TaxID=2609290 RepID=UPI0020050832|nr:MULTISPECIES: acyltransferase family protein [unclassified Microbacterium]MCK6079073.1 acetyltransferase [Microbacterium sp. EYE_382]MCK6084343.1 acetyltransferase [Microbacterium sp. EYE_384]MCK6123428.1 acetyltransferase [Microbacterium sp. EYE_80]MCK6125107.1 acetyltransferase [Microbacterium sp. EYE_79]MCK6140027.1 acetyltransferase [Microbacterium sp. EYE_39]